MMRKTSRWMTVSDTLLRPALGLLSSMTCAKHCIVLVSLDPSIKRKGRGFNPRGDGPASDGVKAGGFETLDSSKDSEDRAARCKYP